MGDYRHNPPYTRILTHIYFLQCLEKEGPNPHVPWRDIEWELVEWLVDQQLSQRSINDFIKNK